MKWSKNRYELYELNGHGSDCRLAKSLTHRRSRADYAFPLVFAGRQGPRPLGACLVMMRHVLIHIGESTMPSKTRRQREQPKTQLEEGTGTPEDQGRTSVHESDPAPNEAPDAVEHRVVYLGWFGLARTLESDFEPYGKRSRYDGNPADCSSGCRYFVSLAPASLSKDWGCCLNKKSPRAGLLTFEHQGCRQFKYGSRVKLKRPLTPTAAIR